VVNLWDKDTITADDELGSANFTLASDVFK